MTLEGSKGIEWGPRGVQHGEGGGKLAQICLPLPPLYNGYSKNMTKQLRHANCYFLVSLASARLVYRVPLYKMVTLRR